MKKSRSMSKVSNNLSKPHFGCYFLRSLVNFKNLIFFGTYGLFMFYEKVEEVLYLIQKI